MQTMRLSPTHANALGVSGKLRSDCREKEGDNTLYKQCNVHIDYVYRGRGEKEREGKGEGERKRERKKRERERYLL